LAVFITVLALSVCLCVFRRQAKPVCELVKSISNFRCKRPCDIVVSGNTAVIPLRCHDDDDAVVASGNRQQQWPSRTIVIDDDNTGRRNDAVVFSDATSVVSATV